MIIQERAKSKHFSYPLFTFPFSSSEFQWFFKRLSFFSTWSPAGDPAKHGESLICKRVKKNQQEKENDKGPSRNKCFGDTLTCGFNRPKLMLFRKKEVQFHKLSPNDQQICPWKLSERCFFRTMAYM